MNTALIKSALTGILLTLATFAFGRNPPSHVRPNPGGGYMITTPGQPPAIVRLNPGGGYTVNKPGQPPTFIRANPGGGYTATRP